jgi:hypothetical protein
LTPTATGTPGCTLTTNYTITLATGATLVAGTTQVDGTTCDDCIVTLDLPFSYTFYDTPYSQVIASNKGTLQFVSSSLSGTNACLPTATLNDAIMAYWDNLNTNINDTMGVYTRTLGTAPNRIFVIEWQSGFIANDVRPRFQVLLYEGQYKFDLVYGQTRNGFSATIGVQEGTGSRSTQWACNTNNSVLPGYWLSFNRCTSLGPGNPGGPPK